MGSFTRKIEKFFTGGNTYTVKFTVTIHGISTHMKVKSKGKDYIDAYNKMVRSVKFTPDPE